MYALVRRDSGSAEERARFPKAAIGQGRAINFAILQLCDCVTRTIWK
jgi:hypothetical protein